MGEDAEAEARAQVAPRRRSPGSLHRWPRCRSPLRTQRRSCVATARNAEYADRPALRFGDRQWTHRELLAESERFAALYRARLDPGRPPHVGLLLDNTPDYVFALCGAGLAGAAVAGLNYTRRGEHLGHDISHTDVQFVITEPRHEEQLRAGTEGVALPAGILVSDRFADRDEPPAAGEPLEQALQAAWADHDAGRRAGLLRPTPTWTHSGRCSSHPGTSAAPKAVRCTQRRLLTTGNRMAMMLELGPEDVGYASMPLFHTNSLMSGLAPALVSGASLSVARRFSASRFLPDVRHYGATWFNYTGKLLTYLLATPARADDADNPLRVAFGNEGSPQVVETAAARFGVRIIDVFGSTEGAIALDRTGNRPTRVHRASATRHHGRRRGGKRGTARGVRRRGPSRQCGSLRRRDGEHARRRAVRGLLPQRGGHAPDHPPGLVLERGPWLRRR